MADQIDKLSEEQKAQIKQEIYEFRPETYLGLFEKAVAYTAVECSPPNDGATKDWMYYEAREQIRKKQLLESQAQLRREMVKLAEEDAGVPVGYLGSVTPSTNMPASKDRSNERFVDHFDRWYEDKKQGTGQVLGACHRSITRL